MGQEGQLKRFVSFALGLQLAEALAEMSLVVSFLTCGYEGFVSYALASFVNISLHLDEITLIKDKS
eukprot:4852512-Amphidinium_carterae.1